MRISKKKGIICGVGVNDADYNVQIFKLIDNKRKCIFFCPFYSRWRHMIHRCYSEKFHQHQPTYIGCSVCDEWLRFSNFKAWMEQQDWEGKHLDKDLLVHGNKVYSPETCCFVDQGINNFLLDRSRERGIHPIGVHLKDSGKFQGLISNPFTRKIQHLGVFDTELEAFLAWREKKVEFARQLALGISDSRVAKALVDTYINFKGD